MQSEIEDLKNMVHDLAAKKNESSSSDSPSEVSEASKEGISVQILEWFEEEDIIIGEGEFYSSEPIYKIGRIPIGPNAVAIRVKYVLDLATFLWRPTTKVSSMEANVGCIIAWPVDKVILD